MEDRAEEECTVFAREQTALLELRPEGSAQRKVFPERRQMWSGLRPLTHQLSAQRPPWMELLKSATER